jgi:uncharacterized protein YjdB
MRRSDEEMNRFCKRFVSSCLALGMAFSLFAGMEPVSAGSVYAEEISNVTEEESLATSGDADVQEIDVEEDTSVLQATEVLEEEEAVTEAQLPIQYKVHQQSYGDSSLVSNGETAGTVGSGKRLEALTISKLNTEISGDIEYRAHCQTYGWMDWVSSGKLAGTTGKSKRMEAVQIRLTGALAEQYDIYYRVYMSNCGWLSWTKNGATAGTSGFGATIEGIQIQVCEKTAEVTPVTGRYAALTTENVNTVTYSGHAQTYGDLSAVTGGAVLGITGQSKRLEGITIKMSHSSSQLYGQIRYKVHCQTYGWQDEVVEGKYAGTKGEAKRMEAISISLTGDIAEYCDIYYRVHVQKLGWLGWAKDGENAGTVGKSLRIEAIQIKIVPKGASAPGSTSHAYYSATDTLTTSGYLLLEPYLDSILASCTNDSMTDEQKLRAVYDYVLDNYKYKNLSANHPSNFSWDEYYAYTIATTGYGNCYAYAAIFCMLARKIGYTSAYVDTGYYGTGPHGWCVIGDYIYDPEIEWKHPDWPRYAVSKSSQTYTQNYHK